MAKNNQTFVTLKIKLKQNKYKINNTAENYGPNQDEGSMFEYKGAEMCIWKAKNIWIPFFLNARNKKGEVRTNTDNRLWEFCRIQ